MKTFTSYSPFGKNYQQPTGQNATKETTPVISQPLGNIRPQKKGVRVWWIIMIIILLLIIFGLAAFLLFSNGILPNSLLTPFVNKILGN